MKLAILSTFVVGWAFAVASGRPRWKVQGDTSHYNQSTCAWSAQGTVQQGIPSVPSPIQNQPDDDEDLGPPTPTGIPLGPIVPSSPQIGFNLSNAGDPILLTKRQDCGGGSNVLFDNNMFVASNGDQPSEPSGARAGNIIFTTGNKYAAISLDGGATFNEIDPTIYSGSANPATDGGFCCDQVVQYLPSIDRFAWLIQYWGNSKNANKLRLITFHPSDLTASGIGPWLFVDFLSTDVKLKNILDFGELAVGNTFISVSATGKSQGLVVIRIPIAALDVVGSFTYHYTNADDSVHAYEARLAQNPGDTLFWAGHSVPGTTMRIFRWPDSGTGYSWTDLRIRDWPADANNFVSLCPGNSSTNWLVSVAFPDVIGATRRFLNEVWFAWAAPSGGGFPNVHVQIARIDVSNWPNIRLIDQPQIWNQDFAFAYPALYTNECGDVGVAVMFGGGSSNPSGAVGIANSDGILTHTVYYPELGDVCENRYGDYLTVRSADGVTYQGFTYADQSLRGGLERNVRYVQFHRG